jgi:dTDP-glucose pyrophosphorylase
LGLSLSYAERPRPEVLGLAQAFVIGREFAGSDPATLVLGYNVFYGQGLSPLLRSATSRSEGAIGRATPSDTASRKSTRPGGGLDRGEAGAAEVASR